MNNLKSDLEKVYINNKKNQIEIIKDNIKIMENILKNYKKGHVLSLDTSLYLGIVSFKNEKDIIQLFNIDEKIFFLF